MQPTPEQLNTIEKLQSNNPSMLPIKWGFTSDTISLHIRWKHEPEATYFLSLDKQGNRVGTGSGPHYLDNK